MKDVKDTSSRFNEFSLKYLASMALSQPLSRHNHQHCYLMSLNHLVLMGATTMVFSFLTGTRDIKEACVICSTTMRPTISHQTFETKGFRLSLIT